MTAGLLGELFDSNGVIADKVIGLGPDHCGREAGVRKQSAGRRKWRRIVTRILLELQMRNLLSVTN